MATHRFALTHTPGLEKPVALWLSQAGAHGIRASEGFVLFSSPHARHDFPWATNVYRVLDEGKAGTAEDWMRWLLRRTGWVSRLEAAGRDGNTFRLVIMERGRLVSAPPKLLEAIEGMIEAAVGWESLRARPMTEIWLVVRADGSAAVMARMSKRRPEDRHLPPGALGSDLCAALAALSDVGKGDAALEPFAGYGGIARALADRGARVACGDDDPAMAEVLISWSRERHGASAVLWDAFGHRWPERGFDVLVTDPPWGAWKPLPFSIKDMAVKLAAMARHALDEEGRAVILWARDDALRAALIAQDFAVRRYDILVHGKKAAVWVADRHGRVHQP